MTSLTFPHIEDSSPEASELADFRLAVKVGGIPVWIPDEEETWFRKYCPIGAARRLTTMA